MCIFGIDKDKKVHFGLQISLDNINLLMTVLSYILA